MPDGQSPWDVPADKLGELGTPKRPSKLQKQLSQGRLSINLKRVSQATGEVKVTKHQISARTHRSS